MRNTMKNVLALALVLVLVLSLAACGSKEATDLAGTTWALSGGSQGDTTLDKATIESMLGGEMTYTFNEDGTVVLALAGVEVEGTWKQDGDSVDVDVEGQTGTMKIDGDKLLMEDSGVSIEFTKK